MAPHSRAALRPPVEPSAIAVAQERTGTAFPEELTGLLALHDGAEDTDAGAFLPGDARLLSAEEAGVLSRRLSGSIDSDEVLGVWWHPQWIPFSANHDGATCYFVDARPGPGCGEVGYFFMESGGECGRWPSLAAFAENLAGAVEDITKMRGCLPCIKDDALTWR
ncbi:SMI1/KNR4 family protein [Streptomyces sp. NPDC005808]|uniref:SMI1/KNR4 family protein n=1 Tax=Streptomyces sp. NPDC005808 TaxID=3364734 RepID=UPI00369398DC